MMSGPKYLTGDKAGIDEFLDKFDVREAYIVTPMDVC